MKEELLRRVDEAVRAWHIDVECLKETNSALLAFGTSDGLPVVLKVIRRRGDEWTSGAVLDAFDGLGTVRVYRHVEGAVLLERLRPGAALTDMVLDGRDEEATEIIADVIQRMSDAPKTLKTAPTVEGWGKGFEHYLATSDNQVPRNLVKQGQSVYSALCSSQRDTRLLHGDLHHDNVLLDSERGWVAIDPKGVIGELEYEIGASLRNPCERPELFASAATAEKRLAVFERKLGIHPDRALAWAFAQAVLSAIWEIEDGFPVDADNPSLKLATALQPMFRSGPSPTGRGWPKAG